jgi:Gas vesicle synthesis protein GvpL/GvpF
VIHLYGLVQDLEELPAVPGIDGAPLERRRIEGFDLVVSRSKRELPEVSEEAVLMHANVVEELMGRSRAVLPARFGRAFTSEEELSDAVKTKARVLACGLTRVRGCFEFGLRVLAREPRRDDSPGTSGSEYMRARLAEAHERDRLSEELHEPLARLSRASARFGGASGDMVHAAYLVAEEDAEAFRERVCSIESAYPGLAVVCTGPWPPYTFADGEDGRERPA